MMGEPGIKMGRVPNILLIGEAEPRSPVAVGARYSIEALPAATLPYIAEAYFESYAGTTTAFTRAEAKADVAATVAGEFGSYQPKHSAIANAGIRGNAEEQLRTNRRGCLGAILVVRDPPYPDVPRGLFVLDLFVIPPRRGKGLGRELVLHAIGAAASEPLVLRVDSSNAPALALYQSMGFTPHTPAEAPNQPLEQSHLL